MSNPSQQALQQAANIALTAKNDINQVLSEAEHGMILIGVNSSLDQVINRLAFLSNTEVKTIGSIDLPPVTNFMGEELSLPKQVTKDDLTPTPSDKDIFLNKVNSLQAQFDTISPEGLLNSYTIAEDIAVLRGVAKRAGVEGYEDREINLRFIEDISKGLKQKAADDLEEKRIEEDLDGLVAAPNKPLAKWNKAQLQAELTRRGIDFETDANNKTLIEKVEAAMLKDETK